MLSSAFTIIHATLLFAIFSYSINPICCTTAQSESRREARTPPDYSALISELKEKVPQMMSQRNVPGLAIALVDGDRLVWAEGFGFTDNSKTVKVSGETLFSLQSISKSYTATGVLRAVQKGWLKLDEPVVKYLPNFTIKSRFGPDEARKITFSTPVEPSRGFTGRSPVGK